MSLPYYHILEQTPRTHFQVFILVDEKSWCQCPLNGQQSEAAQMLISPPPKMTNVMTNDKLRLYHSNGTYRVADCLKWDKGQCIMTHRELGNDKLGKSLLSLLYIVGGKSEHQHLVNGKQNKAAHMLIYPQMTNWKRIQHMILLGETKQHRLFLAHIFSPLSPPLQRANGPTAKQVVFRTIKS